VPTKAVFVEMLDTEVLGELRGLGEDDLRDLLDMYFTDVADQLERLRGGLSQGDAETVASAAHRIKGASLSIGAASVAAHAAELEQAGKTGNLAVAGEELAKLESELEPTRGALSAELAG
jgi:HPt (histidine-containing phosphotransfer) domain-containing protein